MTVEELRALLADMPPDARVWIEAILDDDHGGDWASHVTRLPAPRVIQQRKPGCAAQHPGHNRTQKEPAMTVAELQEMLTDLPGDADIVLEIRISNIPDYVAHYSRRITADPDRITCEDEPDAYYLVGNADEDML